MPIIRYIKVSGNWNWKENFKGNQSYDFSFLLNSRVKHFSALLIILSQKNSPFYICNKKVA
jgi:hypothetical protein